MWPFSRRHTEQRTLTKQNVPAIFFTNGATSSGAAVTPESAMAIDDAFACVRAIADAIASLPLKVYRRTEDGREELRNRTDELLTRPAAGVTQADLLGTIAAHLNLWGAAFVGKWRIGGTGQVTELGCLPPDRVVPELRAGTLVFTYTDAQGKRMTLTQADVVYVKALSLDGLTGLSPVRQAKEGLGVNKRLREHAGKFFAQDARPSGLLKVPAGASQQDDIENLKTAWETRHAGEPHRIAIVSSDVTFDSVGMPPEQAQFLQQRQLSAAEVARIFRVPPWVIGAPTGDSMTYSNVEQNNLHFVQHSLRPWLVRIEQALSADRDLFIRNTYCEFVLDALLRADTATRAGVYTAALNADTGWLDRDEVRRLENLPPDGGRPAERIEEEANA
jgi:HK97 family phage portal protein